MSEAETKALVEFAKEIIGEMVFDACDLDGLDIQDMAEKHGLIRREGYDPAKHGNHYCGELGEDWFVFAGPLSPTN